MREQPQIVIPDSVVMPRTEIHTAKNGVKIYTLQSDDFEVVRFTFVFRAGTSMQHKPFTASATLNMLSEGSRSMTAQQIAETLDFYGTYFDLNIDRDYVYISLALLTKFCDNMFLVLREIILNPTFNDSELRTYCNKRQQGLAIERRKIDVQSRELFGQALFGSEHPYGASDDESLYNNITREDLVKLYGELYTAENCFVVCSGNIDQSVIRNLEQIVEALPSGRKPEVTLPKPETTYSIRKPIDTAVQSSIRIGRLLFPRSHPDFVGMQVVAMILGGYFSSRLMQNLREKNGYTYGVMAAMINFDKEGYLAIATQVRHEEAEAALAEIYFEIERLRRELISEEELQLAKNMMIGEILRILDGPFGIADVTIENIMCGTDNSATEENLQAILAITPEQVQELAVKYLRREDLVEVVVG
ncbi:MAG: insulinase family protein [Alistipes sp.]|nr:insulinase family protein [Alistipes sp.]